MVQLLLILHSIINAPYPPVTLSPSNLSVLNIQPHEISINYNNEEFHHLTHEEYEKVKNLINDQENYLKNVAAPPIIIPPETIPTEKKSSTGNNIIKRIKNSIIELMKGT